MFETRKDYETAAPLVFRKMKDQLFHQNASVDNEDPDENP